MSDSKVLIVIPCRYASTRLKKKHLIEFSNGKTLFEMTYENSLLSCADKVIVATDHELIFNKAKEKAIEVEMTKDLHRSGSDRVAEVAANHTQYDIILNVQGDEPFIDPKNIDLIINTIKNSNKNIVAVTAMCAFKEERQIFNPSNVKVITNKNNEAVYFSRSVIPYDRSYDKNNKPLDIADYKKHLGIYAYKRDFLFKYVNLPQGFLEKKESLEQLRIIENNYKIKVVEIDDDSIGVDTQDDVEKVENILNNF